jgi:hypothetical protein
MIWLDVFIVINISPTVILVFIEKGWLVPISTVVNSSGKHASQIWVKQSSPEWVPLIVGRQSLPN